MSQDSTDRVQQAIVALAGESGLPRRDASTVVGRLAECGEYGSVPGEFSPRDIGRAVYRLVGNYDGNDVILEFLTGLLTAVFKDCPPKTEEELDESLQLLSAAIWSRLPTNRGPH
jgi:hypothetical protein